MDKSYLGKKVKEYRTKKGLSQELLAEDSGLSYRTIQRIENGESKPTGDTLNRIAASLDVTPEDLANWEVEDDLKFLVFLNLSALSFILFPILGILIPFIVWTAKRGKVVNLDQLGKALINFQITWTLTLMIAVIAPFVAAKTGILAEFIFSKAIIIVLIAYALNALIIVANTILLTKGKPARYFSLIKFL